jgi:ATP-dependent helicase STH1/SNF2
LQANEPVAVAVEQAIDPNFKEKEQATGNVAQKIVETAFRKEQPPEPSNPYSYFTRPVTAGDLSQRMLVPAILPIAVDPIDLKDERDRMIKLKVTERIKELSEISNNITNDNDVKLKALIELKSLQLMDKQANLRMDLLKSVSKATTLATAIDRAAFRRMKKQTLREARQTEKTERALRGEKEKRERQKHLDFLNHVLTHGRDFLSHHRQHLGKMQKLGQAVIRFHSAALKEEERRLQKHSQERLNALKANDEEAYMKLLDKTKDTRITTILNQTNAFLSTLITAVEKQKQSVADIDTGYTEAEADGEDNGDYYSSAHRIQEIVTEQSSLLVGGALKDYQIKGLQWMVSLYNNRLNGILADEMGLGKTIQTLALITYLVEKKRQPGPFLVIVPLSTITNWVLEFEKWAPSIVKIVYKGGSAETRRQLANEIRAGNFNVLLTTYEYIINPKDRPVLCKVKWVHMIIDEGHRMKNANSKLAVTLMQFYTSRYRLILTGTPLQNNLPELWALLNFILPKIFNSVKSFDEWFNSPFNASSIQERIELNEEEQLLIIRRLHKVLRPFLLRRLKKDVESELPDKVETVIKCPMSALQLRLTEQIRNRKYNTEAFGKKKSLNNLVMQFRKICNHPYVFSEVEDALNPMSVTDRNLFRVAGKFEMLDRILPKLQALDHRVLMFFQMTEVMNIMEDYLRWKGMSYLRLDGTTKADDRTAMLHAFNRGENPPFLFLLSTRAGGLGLNLQSADTVIIYDSDW